MSVYDVGFFVFAALASLGMLWIWGRLITFAATLRHFRDHPPVPECKCDSKIAALRASLTETEDALSLLANKVKMQRVRTATQHVREDELPAETGALKDRLRRKAGLVAGQPAPHSS